LTIGACFSVCARNERDPTRRVSIAGFCQSVDLLFHSVEDLVMMRGGEILDEQRAIKRCVRASAGRQSIRGGMGWSWNIWMQASAQAHTRPMPRLAAVCMRS
jgi:hypothetical protein